MLAVGLVCLRYDPVQRRRVVHAAVGEGVAQGLVHGGGDVDVVDVAAHALVDGPRVDRLAVGGDGHLGAEAVGPAVEDAGVHGHVHAVGQVGRAARAQRAGGVADPGDLARVVGAAGRGAGGGGGGGGGRGRGGGGRGLDDDGRLGCRGGLGRGRDVRARAARRLRGGRDVDGAGAGDRAGAADLLDLGLGRGLGGGRGGGRALEELAGRAGADDGGQGGRRGGGRVVGGRYPLGGGGVDDLDDGLGLPLDDDLRLQDALGVQVSVLVLHAGRVLVGVPVVRLREGRGGRRGQGGKDDGRGLHGAGFGIVKFPWRRCKRSLLRQTALFTFDK